MIQFVNLSVTFVNLIPSSEGAQVLKENFQVLSASNQFKPAQPGLQRIDGKTNMNKMQRK